MSSRNGQHGAEIRVVQLAAIAQGIALVTFPATGTILTSPRHFDLSSSAYGVLFVPQAVTAIASALGGASLSRRVSTRTLLLVGLAANTFAMSLLVLSAAVTHHRSLPFALLLLATGSLGVGFGLTVPALNTLTAAFHPAKVDASVLVLNAMLGVGTALAPAFVAVFIGLGAWWLLPLLVAVSLAALLARSTRLPLAVVSARPATHDKRRRVRARFWLYGAFAACYGICETMNGNWATLDMKQLGASTAAASIALTAFWACVTAGRVLFADLRKSVPTRWTYRLLPLVLAAAFVVIAVLPDDEPVLGVAAFALAGLGCSALLPLTISFGQEELVTIPTAVAGGVIACYQFGYGIAAFGAGPLQHAGVELSTLFGCTAAVAVVAAAFAFAIVRPRPEPPSHHPRPAHPGGAMTTVEANGRITGPSGARHPTRR